jgi:UDP-N-acetylglucosamine--N-acetylmuramyl-(pentapeptide) pyrophosphoryl-undecaprenol N-acetylglucosamine transferase
MAAALPHLKELHGQFRIVHQTGAADLEVVTHAYAAAGIDANVVPFISDMGAAYRAADLVVCRAGATTIAEVTACGKACIFIPFPHATDDHQRRNAEALLKKGAGFVLLEPELSGPVLAGMIIDLVRDPETVRRTGALAAGLARIDAARIIVDEMMKPVEKTAPPS